MTYILERDCYISEEYDFDCTEFVAHQAKYSEFSKRNTECGHLLQEDSIPLMSLPYFNLIDYESKCLFSNIKSNLIKSIYLNDLPNGLRYSVNCLIKYIEQFKLRFCREDHIALINILYPITMQTNLDIFLLEELIKVLNLLLSSRKLLAPGLLTLHWKPLYKLYNYFAFGNELSSGMLSAEKTFVNDLKIMVTRARNYFPLNATRDILEKFRPKFCPCDVKYDQICHILYIFLPTIFHENQLSLTVDLWKDEILNMWHQFDNNWTFQWFFTMMFERLAHIPAYLTSKSDMDRHLERLITFFHRNLSLPIGKSMDKVEGSKLKKWNIRSFAAAFVFTMGPNTSHLDRLVSLMNALESYYYPSNVGRWTSLLSELLCELMNQLEIRLWKERVWCPYLRTWEPRHPSWFHLSDKQVERFCKILAPIVLDALFTKCKMSQGYVLGALRLLAHIWPSSVMPQFLDLLFSALNTVAEPHRLYACLKALFMTGASLVQRGPDGYQCDGVLLVRLLHELLPCLDPNDMEKYMNVQEALLCLLSLLKIEDCSFFDGLSTQSFSEEEIRVAAVTGELVDFAHLLVHRVLEFAECASSDGGCRVGREATASVVQSNLDREEKLYVTWTHRTMEVLLCQSCSKVRCSILDQVYQWIMRQILTSRATSVIAGNLCQSLMFYEPDATLRKFVPYMNEYFIAQANLCNFTLDEKVDSKTMWNISIFSWLVIHDNAAWLHWKSQLLNILQILRPIRDKMASSYVRSIFNRLFGKSLLAIYPVRVRDVTVDPSVPNYLAVREWGRLSDAQNMKVEWHVPSDEEVRFAQELFQLYLLSALCELDDFVAGNTIFDRHQLEEMLEFIAAFIEGASLALPHWGGVELEDLSARWKVKTLSHSFSTGLSQFDIQLKGQNTRARVMQTIVPLMHHMLKTCSDNAKAFASLIKTYKFCIYPSFMVQPRIEISRFLRYYHSKFGSRLFGFRKYTPWLFNMHVSLVHGCMVSSGFAVLDSQTSTHLLELVDLCHSRYNEVQQRSRECLRIGMQAYPGITLYLSKHLTKNLSSTAEDHELVAALRLLTDFNGSLIRRASWEIRRYVLPAFLRAITNPNTRYYQRELGTLQASLQRKCWISRAVHWKKVTPSSNILSSFYCAFPKHSVEKISEEEVKDSASWFETQCSTNFENYKQTLLEIVNILDDSESELRSLVIQGAEIFTKLLALDGPDVPQVTRWLLSHLSDPNIEIRLLVSQALSGPLLIAYFQQKRRKILCHELNTESRENNLLSPLLDAGLRSDNIWLCSIDEIQPLIHEDEKLWNRHRFVHNAWLGYSVWPRKVYHLDPLDSKLLNKKSYNESQGLILSHFCSQDNMDSFLRSFTALDMRREILMHGEPVRLPSVLVSCFGMELVEQMRPFLQRMVMDQKAESQHRSHRAVLMVIACLLDGIAHWPRQDISDMWSWLLSLVDALIEQASRQLRADIVGLMALINSNSYDPVLLQPLWQHLLSKVKLSESNGSLQDILRIDLLGEIVWLAKWRAPIWWHQLFRLLSPLVDHPLAKMRQICSRFLTAMLNSATLRGGNTGGCDIGHLNICNPYNLFLEIFIPKLERVLCLNSEDDVNGKDNAFVQRRQYLNPCLTLLPVVSISMRSMMGAAPEFFLRLIPVICHLSAFTTNQEEMLDVAVTQALSSMATALVRSGSATDTVLFALETSSRLSFWQARCSALKILQAMVYHNLVALGAEEPTRRICRILLSLLCDRVLEVREAAAVALSGLLQCGIIQPTQNLLTQLIKYVDRHHQHADLPELCVAQRHGGVLGMAACIEAHPYSVPPHIPNILMQLSELIHEPHPIRTTARRTFAQFKRTHLDNWQKHKAGFTIEQLEVLNDVLVSDCYYA